MAYPPKLKPVEFPDSAYRWVLLDSVRCEEKELFAVYKHNDKNAWCVITKSDITNSIDVFILSKNKIPSYIKTDAECLINLITNSIDNNSPFVIKGFKKGTVSDAYKLIN